VWTSLLALLLKDVVVDGAKYSNKGKCTCQPRDCCVLEIELESIGEFCLAAVVTKAMAVRSLFISPPLVVFLAIHHIVCSRASSFCS